MAFTTPFISLGGKSLIAYNIDWSVGRIGSNTREDVMLVQALFKIFYYELVGYDPPPGSTTIVVDGRYGPITQTHITHFQQQAIEDGKKVQADGIFDPFRKPGSGALSPNSKSVYALDLLNNCCAVFCERQGMDVENNYINLPNRQDMPLSLRNALKRVKKTANKYTHVPVTVPATGGA